MSNQHQLPAGVSLKHAFATSYWRTRRLLGRWKRRVRSLTQRSHRAETLHVSDAGWMRIRVHQAPGRAVTRRFDDADYHVQANTGCVKLDVSDIPTLVRIVLSGVLTGRLTELHVRVRYVPDWHLMALRPPRPERDQIESSWRRIDDRLELKLGWAHPHDVHRALSDVLSATTRHRLWDSSGGTVYATDRNTWLAGQSLWPQAQITGRAPAPKTDDDGRLIGPYLPVSDELAPTPGSDISSSRTSLLANPYGRLLAGSAHRYHLLSRSDRLAVSNGSRTIITLDKSQSPESAIELAGMHKYSVIACDRPALVFDEYTVHVLRTLAAGGAVFTSQDQATRLQLSSQGLVTVDNPDLVTDVQGYALSVAAARRAATYGDAVLRRTVLGGGTTLSVPAVTVVMSSKRPDDVPTCLAYLAAQTYPNVEIVIGTHGYAIDEDTRKAWEKAVPFALRVEAIPAEHTLGMALARLSSIADGDLVTKVDDDDHYGANHITDLMLAWHQSGADLAAKGARFVHLPDLGKTIDRQWAAREQFNGTPAGGTLLLARSTLEQVGGWSTSPRRVDADLIKRIRSRGGATYRTHALGYVYVRRTDGHTWPAEIDELMSQSKRNYDGLPDQLITADSVEPAGA